MNWIKTRFSLFGLLLSISCLAQPGGGDMTMRISLLSPEGKHVGCRSDYRVVGHFAESNRMTGLTGRWITDDFDCKSGEFTYEFGGTPIGMPDIPPEFKVHIIYAGDTMTLINSYQASQIPFVPGVFAGVTAHNELDPLMTQSRGRISGYEWNIEEFRFSEEKASIEKVRPNRYPANFLFSPRKRFRPLAFTTQYTLDHSTEIAVIDGNQVKYHRHHPDHYFLCSHAPDSFNLSQLRFDTLIKPGEPLVWDQQPLLSFSIRQNIIEHGEVAFLEVEDVNERNRTIDMTERLYMSRDQGYTWVRILPKMVGDFSVNRQSDRVLVSDGEDLHFIDEAGNIITSNLHGSRRQWDQTIYPGNFTFLDKNTGFLHLRQGLYKTIDGGLNWELLLSPINVTNTLKAGDRLIADVFKNRYLVSDDLGETWTYRMVDFSRIKGDVDSEGIEVGFFNDQLVMVNIESSRAEMKEEAERRKIRDKMGKRERDHWKNGLILHRYYTSIPSGSYFRNLSDTSHQGRLIITGKKFRYEPFYLDPEVGKGSPKYRELRQKDYHEKLIEGTISMNDTKVEFKTKEDSWLKGKWFYGFDGKTICLSSEKNGHNFRMSRADRDFYSFPELERLKLMELTNPKVYSFTPENMKVKITITYKGEALEGATIRYAKARARADSRPGIYYLDQRMINSYTPDGKYYKQDQTGVKLIVSHPDHPTREFDFFKSGDHRYEMSKNKR